MNLFVHHGVWKAYVMQDLCFKMQDLHTFISDPLLCKYSSQKRQTDTTQNKNQDVQNKDIVLGPRNVFTRDQYWSTQGYIKKIWRFVHFSASSFFKTAYVFYEQYIFAYFVEVERIFFALSACKRILMFYFCFLGVNDFFPYQ